MTHRNFITSIKGNNEKYSIVIPAAGIGKRMKSYGVKSMIKLSTNHCVIDRQLNILNTYFPNNEIIVVCGFESEKVMKHLPDNILKVENENFEETNVVRSIGMGLRVCSTNNVLIVYGDVVFSPSCLQGSFNHKSIVVIDESNSMGPEEVGCIINNSRVEHALFDLPNKWAQILYITGRELDLLKEFCWNRNNFNKFGFEAINYIIDKGGKLFANEHKGSIAIDIDSPEDIERAKKIK